MARTITEHYAELGELDRLTATPQGRLEYLRTRELIERVLPAKPADVLDVGGATGSHARWLAEAGHRVHVVDPERPHVEQAARLPGVTASVGDARSLDHPAASADVVLLLGPLYHLTDAADRHVALTEARRVARPGAVVVAAAIGRYASMLDLAGHARLVDDAIVASVADTVRTGVHDPEIGFTTAYFHTAGELHAEFETAGLTGVSVSGIEGPSFALLYTAQATEQLFASVLNVARLTERDPALLDAGSHLLAIGYA